VKRLQLVSEASAASHQAVGLGSVMDTCGLARRSEVVGVEPSLVSAMSLVVVATAAAPDAVTVDAVVAVAVAAAAAVVVVVVVVAAVAVVAGGGVVAEAIGLAVTEVVTVAAVYASEALHVEKPGPGSDAEQRGYAVAVAAVFAVVGRFGTEAEDAAGVEKAAGWALKEVACSSRSCRCRATYPTFGLVYE
jgi:hypothetical protein